MAFDAVVRRALQGDCTAVADKIPRPAADLLADAAGGRLAHAAAPVPAGAVPAVRPSAGAGAGGAAAAGAECFFIECDIITQCPQQALLTRDTGALDSRTKHRRGHCFVCCAYLMAHKLESMQVMTLRSAQSRQVHAPGAHLPELRIVFTDVPQVLWCPVDADGRADVGRFPHFWDPALPRPLHCEVHAGEVLYLPAGWYHQVRSCSLFCL